MSKTSGSSLTPVRANEQLAECYSVTARGFKYLQTQEALDRCAGDYKKAADTLGVRRKTLCRYLDRADLHRAPH
jgi:DNA-binding NtrC family response regulator